MLRFQFPELPAPLEGVEHLGRPSAGARFMSGGGCRSILNNCYMKKIIFFNEKIP